MGLATLGDITFRINPTLIEWNFDIETNVTETVGGRVVQVVGATLSDLVLRGSYGEDRTKGDSATDDGAGRSWRLAEAFVTRVRSLIEQQSADAQTNKKMNSPLVFKYPAKGWNFSVYVKSVADARGDGSVVHQPGKFSYDYAITLFIVADNSATVVRAGSSNGVIDKKKQAAINAYIGRISKGIGWHTSGYSDPSLLVDWSAISGGGPDSPSPADVRIIEERANSVVPGGGR